MKKTTNLGLQLSGTGTEDLDQTFQEWRLQMNGEGVNSNMELIDKAHAQVQSQVASLTTQINNVKDDMDDLTAADVGARPSTWLPTISDINAMSASVTGAVVGNVVQYESSGKLKNSGVSGSKLAKATLVTMVFDSNTGSLSITTL